MSIFLRSFALKKYERYTTLFYYEQSELENKKCPCGADSVRIKIPLLPTSYRKERCHIVAPPRISQSPHNSLREILFQESLSLLEYIELTSCADQVSIEFVADLTQ